MRVRDLLALKHSRVITVGSQEDLAAAIGLLMRQNIGGLPVLAPNGTAVGFVAERDIVRAVQEHRGEVHHLRVLDVMRPPPICEGDDTLEQVMRRMTREHLRHLVVRDSGKIVGVISVGDIVKHRLEQLETETGVLRDYVAGQRATR